MITKRIKIYGLVQGIGFRPFVKKQAVKYGVTGQVINAGGIVTVIVRGNLETVDAFVDSLICDSPAGARIKNIETEILEESREFLFFDIKESEELVINAPIMIPSDIATCEKCEAELFDKNNRRYKYPFISCVSCGPRYSIIEDLSYDRYKTTMRSFKMCINCQKEYKNVDNIRCHAQTIGCKACGPKLLIYDGNENKKNSMDETDKIEAVINAIKNEEIIGLKDIGGYHLVCLANSKRAVDRLRKLKGREKKPFAVMFENIASVEKYCDISGEEKNELLSVERPIVLLKKKRDFTANVCNNSYEIGAMLPSNPLQLILMKEIKEPLIMTSANISGLPIIIDDNQMIEWVKACENISLVLYHDRKIVTPLDDSIVHFIDNRKQLIRRARGYVPEPIELDLDFSSDMKNTQIFAAGGDLKAVMGFYKNGCVYLSQYLGDVENEYVEKLYLDTKMRMKRLLSLNEKISVIDKHPLYFTGNMIEKGMGKKQGEESEKTIVKSVQHHKAHMASVMAEQGIKRTEKCVGIVFDGTGYGDDENVWGGEFFYYDGNAFERFDSINKVELIGGNEGAKNAKSILYGYIAEIEKEKRDVELRNAFYELLEDEEKKKFEIINKAINMKLNTVSSTSAGRLFDAVSALLGICDYNNYEGQCACELEKYAFEYLKKMEMNGETSIEICRVDERNSTLAIFFEIMKEYIESNKECDIEDAEEDNKDNKENKEEKLGCIREKLALKFHYMLAELICNKVDTFAREKCVDKILLSGGSFVNRILTERCIMLLEKKGYKVYINELVPSGDGGIALGQIYLAALK